MKTMLGALGAVFLTCAGIGAEEAIARIAVANHSRSELAIGVEEKARRLLLFDHPEARVMPLRPSAEAVFLVPAGAYRIVLNGRPTLREVPLSPEAGATFEFLPPAPDRPGVRVRIASGKVLLYDGPIEGLLHGAAAEERHPHARAREEWRDYHWKREETERRQPPAFFSCPIHPWVTSTSADPCPLCGDGMRREW